MEYLADLITTVPDGTSQAKVDELRVAEAARAAELTKTGHLIRLWRPPLNPGEWRSIGLFRAADKAEAQRNPRVITPSYLDEDHNYTSYSTSQ